MLVYQPTFRRRINDVEDKTKSDVGFSTLHNVDTTLVPDVETTLHNVDTTLYQRSFDVS